MNEVTKCKLVFLWLVKTEMEKKRDHDGKGTPIYGEKSNAAAACLLQVSDEYEKLLTRIKNGEGPETIIPNYKAYKEESE